MKKYKNIRYISDTENCLEIILCEKSLIPYHVHNHVFHFTAGIITEGVIKININGKTDFYKKNDFFIIPPYTPHSITPINPYSMASICVNKKVVKKLSIDEIKHKIEDFLKENSLNFFTDSISRKFTNLTAYKLKFIKYEENFGINKNLKNRLEIYPENSINIYNMAKTEYISKYQFIRNFKTKIGLTPHKFLIQNRIRKAQKLIKENISLTEIAVNTGFYDQSHFIKYFKDIVGLTPTDYKMALEQNIDFNTKLV